MCQKVSKQHTVECQEGSHVTWFVQQTVECREISHAYLFCRKNTVDFIKTQDSLKKDVELVGSWTVNVGDQDQALHLWKFTGGYEKIDDYNEILGKSEVRNIIFIKVNLEMSF